jgi:PKD repeat protein
VQKIPQHRQDPCAAFSASPGELRVGQTLHLFDASSDPSGVGIAWRAWDFGDDETATGSYPTHRYAAGGSYTITLTLATFDGRLGTASRKITVAPVGSNEDLYFGLG